MRRALYLLPVLGFTALIALIVPAFLRPYDPHVVPSPLIDQPIPRFDLAAPEAQFSDETLAGQVALVNFFASWCVPCRLEHPLLMRLADEQHVPVYGIAYNDKPENTARFLAQMGNPYRRIGFDENRHVGIDFGITGVPETFVIDKSGHIRRHYGAPLTADELRDDLLPLLRELARS